MCFFSCGRTSAFNVYEPASGCGQWVGAQRRHDDRLGARQPSDAGGLARGRESHSERKGYANDAGKREARSRGICWGVLDRAKRGQPLSGKQQSRNRHWASVRAKVEHPFRVIKCGAIGKCAIEGWPRTRRSYGACLDWPTYTWRARNSWRWPKRRPSQ